MLSATGNPKRNPNRTPKRKENARTLLAAAVGLCGLAIWGAPSASGQSLYVTSNMTIAGGNPINGNFDSVTVGADAALNPYPNLTADITGGVIGGVVSSLNGSTVNISGGTIGDIHGSFNNLALNVDSGGTINLSGGTIQSFVFVQDSGGGAVNTFNVTGGTLIRGLINVGDGHVSISGGTFNNTVINGGSGTIDVTGGSLTTLAALDADGTGGITNFGGTAYAGSLSASGGTLNVTGGSIGSGGVSVTGDGTANFIGTGLAVTATGTSGSFDPNAYVNIIVTQYSVSGTGTGGAPLNTTVSAGSSFTNNGSAATFHAADLAPDLNILADQSATGVYNVIRVGSDETESVRANPTVTVNADTVFLFTYAHSTTTMTGGIVRGYLYVAENSTFNMSGGDSPGGIYSDGGTTMNISGGSTPFLGVSGTATVSGGDIGQIQLAPDATVTVQGTGLATAGSAISGYDPASNTMYILGGTFEVTGTLADGTSFDQFIVASTATGTSTQQTLAAPIIAPDLNLTDDASVNAMYNTVNVGTNEDGSVLTSPTVALVAGANIATVTVQNQSILNVHGGTVNNAIYTFGDSAVNISGGTVGAVLELGPGAGKITVSGGDTAYVGTFNQTVVTAGHVGTIQAYSGKVRVDGGTVDIIDIQSTDDAVSIYGGSIGEILGGGGTVDIYGGVISGDTLLNFRDDLTLFDIFGTGLALGDATLGSYTDADGTTYDGAWWTVSGTLDSGDPLSTRYFELNGTLGGPADLVFNVAVPEASNVGWLIPVLTVLTHRRKR